MNNDANRILAYITKYGDICLGTHVFLLHVEILFTKIRPSRIWTTFELARFLAMSACAWLYTGIFFITTIIANTHQEQSADLKIPDHFDTLTGLIMCEIVPTSICCFLAIVIVILYLMKTSSFSNPIGDHEQHQYTTSIETTYDIVGGKEWIRTLIFLDAFLLIHATVFGVLFTHLQPENLTLVFVIHALLFLYYSVLPFAGFFISNIRSSLVSLSTNCCTLLHGGRWFRQEETHMSVHFRSGL